MSHSHLPAISTYVTECGDRLEEIKDIERQLDHCEHGLRAFQKLPRNMQRRAVSHNPQRLPRSLREKHKREVGSKIKVNKRPSRKYRRKPSNLLAEYNRRQRESLWLETHIWHAKRFHMSFQWGYTLPKSPTMKAYRSSLRAATESCLIQDVSYEICFEIEAEEYSHVRDPLSVMVSPDDFLILKQLESKKGFEWVHVTLYERDKYPFCSIGDCQIIWISNTSNNSVKLWLWVHPSVYEETMENLTKTFGYERVEAENNESNKLKPVDHILEAKLLPKQWTLDKTPKYVSENTILTVLKDSLVKFRLIGPKSYPLLRRALQPSTVIFNNNEGMGNISHSDNGDSDPWWIKFFSSSSNVEAYKSQLQLLESSLQNVERLRRAFSVVVRDPRVVLPVKKEAFEGDTEMESITDGEAKSACLCAVHPICESGIRESVTVNMLSTFAINEMRSKLMVPGTRLPLTEKESRIPVMLLERPSSHVSMLGSGWDVVMPCGWGTQTLVAFVMNGGVIGGQSQEETLKGEFLMPPNSYQLPDTAAGQRQILKQKQEAEIAYFKRPPNCRLNFIKLGVQFPFGIDWLELLKSFNPSCEKFYVLRDRKVLNLLSLKSCKKIEKLSRKRALSDDAKGKEDNEQSFNTFLGNTPQKLEKLKDSLVYVRLVLLEKGSLEPFAMICLPTEEDLKAFADDSICKIVEPSHEDKNALKRKDMKAVHTKNLNSLRRKRKKARDKVLCGEENPLAKHATMKDALKVAVDAVNEQNKDLVDTVNAYELDIRKLWLHNSEREDFQCCSRKIIGFLTEGGFYMRMGRSGGLGYVVTETLLRYMDTLQLFKRDQETSPLYVPKQVVVLVRKPSTLEYKWARLVVLNVWN